MSSAATTYFKNFPRFLRLKTQKKIKNKKFSQKKTIQKDVKKQKI